jgi:hypothetical protein
MTPSENDVPQESVGNFHNEIVKAISRMMMRAIIRGFDIIIEKLYDCKLSFKIAKKEPMSIDTLLAVRVMLKAYRHFLSEEPMHRSRRHT